jgi:hypothetical protein
MRNHLVEVSAPLVAAGATAHHVVVGKCCTWLACCPRRRETPAQVTLLRSHCCRSLPVLKWLVVPDSTVPDCIYLHTLCAAPFLDSALALCLGLLEGCHLL